MNKIKCNNCESVNPINFKYCSSCGFELPIQKTEINLEQPIQKHSSKKMGKKQLIGIVVGMLVFFLSYYGVQQMFFKLPSIDKQMMEMASELNKSCPIMVDQETRLDNCVALPNKMFQYNYSLISLKKESFDLQFFEEEIKPVIINSIKTNPQLKPFRDNNVTLVYYYKDVDGAFLTKFEVTPELYNQ